MYLHYLVFSHLFAVSCIYKSCKTHQEIKHLLIVIFPYKDNVFGHISLPVRIPKGQSNMDNLEKLAT
jgi:hypothetical protein